MAHGVEVDPEAGLALCRHSSSSERSDGLFRLLDVLDADVEVQLLRMLGIRPPRRDPPRNPLEGELAVARDDAYDDPGTILHVLVDLHSKHGSVERSKLPGIRTVEDGLLQASNHQRILPLVI